MADEVLRVTTGPASGGVISPGDVFTIGRAESGAGALADDPEISRQHARISRSDGGELVIEDLGSTNGTFVNGQRIQAVTALMDGDRIAVGKTILEVSAPSPPPTTPTPGDIAGDQTVLVPGRPPRTPEPPPAEPPTPPPPAFEPPTPPPPPAFEPPTPPPPPVEPPPPEPEPEPTAPEPTPPQPVFDPGAATVLEPAPPELQADVPEPPPAAPESEGPIPMHVLDFLRHQRTLTLATTGDGGPWATTLIYVHSGPDIYFWTDADSNTAGHLRDNPRAGFTIDEYAYAGERVKGLHGRGECSLLDGTGKAAALDLFEDKFPDVRPEAAGEVSFYKLTPRAFEFHDATRSAEQGAEYHTESPVIPPYMD